MKPNVLQAPQMTPSMWLQQRMADALSGLGVSPYRANKVTHTAVDALTNFTPLGTIDDIAAQSRANRAAMAAGRVPDTFSGNALMAVLAGLPGGKFAIGGVKGVVRDVEEGALNGLGAAANRIRSKMTEQGQYTVATMRPQDLIATQAAVNADYAQAAAKRATGNPEDFPAVFKANGKYYLADGHHRIAATDGNPAKVRIYDIDGAMGRGAIDFSAPLFDALGDGGR